jgi:hypothetical protein
MALRTTTSFCTRNAALLRETGKGRRRGREKRESRTTVTQIRAKAQRHLGGAPLPSHRRRADASNAVADVRATKEEKSGGGNAIVRRGMRAEAWSSQSIVVRRARALVLSISRPTSQRTRRSTQSRGRSSGCETSHWARANCHRASRSPSSRWGSSIRPGNRSQWESSRRSG